MSRLRVGILGATGAVGQRYVQLLEGHPLFETTFLAGSVLSAGKPYSKAVEGRWLLETEIPNNIQALEVSLVSDLPQALQRCDFVFSALSSDAAREFEAQYAEAGLPVLSNASAFRKDEDIPVLIPEINAHHLDILPAQRSRRNWKGFIVTKPNCSIQSYMFPLHALDKAFGIEKVMVTTMQAISGAGHPGVSSMDILGNIVPNIEGEEDKSEAEPLKIWGEIIAGKIFPRADISISAQCNRVPVRDGHMASVSVKLKEKVSQEEALDCICSLKGLSLPSTPGKLLYVHDKNNRPQPLLDVEVENGMGITVGHFKPCKVLDYRFVCLSHNTVRGAAGGGILNAELLHQKQLLTKRTDLWSKEMATSQN